MQMMPGCFLQYLRLYIDHLLIIPVHEVYHHTVDTPFFELGKGGVDFPAIKAHLDQIGWRGWMTVELDSSPYRPPKESAVISRRYIENTLKIKVA